MKWLLGVYAITFPLRFTWTFTKVVFCTDMVSFPLSEERLPNRTTAWLTRAVTGNCFHSRSRVDAKSCHRWTGWPLHFLQLSVRYHHLPSASYNEHLPLIITCSENRQGYSPMTPSVEHLPTDEIGYGILNPSGACLEHVRSLYIEPGSVRGGGSLHVRHAPFGSKQEPLKSRLVSVLVERLLNSRPAVCSCFPLMLETSAWRRGEDR